MRDSDIKYMPAVIFFAGLDFGKNCYSRTVSYKENRTGRNDSNIANNHTNLLSPNKAAQTLPNLHISDLFQD